MAKQSIKNIVLNELRQGPMTASEIAASAFQKGLLPTPLSKQIAPRLSELFHHHMELIQIVGKRKDKVTNRTVLVWGLAPTKEEVDEWIQRIDALIKKTDE